MIFGYFIFFKNFQLWKVVFTPFPPSSSLICFLYWHYGLHDGRDVGGNTILWPACQVMRSKDIQFYSIECVVFNGTF